jgi:transposase
MKRATPVREVLLSPLPKKRGELVKVIVDQAELIELLRQENKRLHKENETLRKKRDQGEKNIQKANQRIADLQQLEEAQRAAHRQAAPFRIPETKRTTDPKKPGRRKGHPGACRPRPDHVDEKITVALQTCPKCGGPVTGVEAVGQFIEDIPPVRPHVTHLVTHVGQCARCGEVRSTHPLQVSTATRAAGTHRGPRALAVALDLNQHHGLTSRKTCRVLQDLFGLSLTAGGLVQARHRLAGKLQPAYDRLVNQARRAPAIHTDETSGWVGGPKWWLWVYTHPRLTVYAVRQSRGRDVVHEILGPTFPGVLVSDCLSVYDNATALQHKCYAHHHKAVRDATKRHPDGKTPFLHDLRQLLRSAQQLKTDTPTLAVANFRKQRHALDRSAKRRIVPPRTDPIEEAVANRFRKQLDHLFTFLDHPPVDATNNLAERQLRPAVIARKLSCGNRTERGARTWEILASLSATCLQQGASFRDLIAHTARLHSPQTAR